MDANQHGISGANVTLHQRHMFDAVDLVAINNGPIHAAVYGGQLFLSDTLNQALVAQPIGDQIRHRDDLKSLLFGQPTKSRQQCHRTVVGQNLADDARRLEAS